MELPKCYDAALQFDARDRRQTRLAKKRPQCQGCGEPIQTETALDLRPFGLAGFACQRCVDRHSRDENQWTN